MSEADYGRHFSALADRYDRLRADLRPELVEAVVERGDLRGRRVLDVGCGTGVWAAELALRHGAKVWGVEPSPEMVAAARARVPRGVGIREGRAEELPFRDGWFERTLMVLVVHLLDRPRAFAELRRVLAAGGRAAVATTNPERYDQFWMAPLFPSYVAVERARFPDAATLERELAAAGFDSVDVARLPMLRRFSREQALAKLRGRAYSTFELLNPDELEAGIERAERELPDPVEYELEWLIAVGAVDSGRPKQRE
jgi:ubiquinone/menaquinone biosynthesis C-methylase UbiE